MVRNGIKDEVALHHATSKTLFVLGNLDVLNLILNLPSTSS
jgi:hypothetical protein